MIAKLPDDTEFDIFFPCYVYSTSTKRLEQFQLRTSNFFAVGIAVSPHIANEKADGTLGLGLDELVSFVLPRGRAQLTTQRLSHSPRFALFDKNGVIEPVRTTLYVSRQIDVRILTKPF